MLQLKDMTLVLRGSPPLEAKFATGPDESGTVSGYGSVFGGPPDFYGDVVVPGAFAKTIAEHRADNRAPAMLWAHDMVEPIGRWTDFRENERGLWLEGEINRSTQRGREALSLIKQGAVTGLSIGYRVLPGGRKRGENGVFELSEVELLEISVVAVPANHRARLVDAKSVGNRRDYERFLKAAGFANGAAKKLALGGWPALGSPDDTIADELACRIKAATAELEGLNNGH